MTANRSKKEGIMQITPHRPRKRFTVAALMCALTATALTGGTLAQLTDRDTTTPQVIRAGTFVANIEQGANWGQDLCNMGVGDTADRSITLVNGSAKGVSKITLFADITSTPGPGGGDLSEVVMVDIVQDGGTQIATGVALADLADGYDLTFTGGDLPAAGEAGLGFRYTVVGALVEDDGSGPNPDNAYQSSALNIRYTINAVFNTADGGEVEDSLVVAPEDVAATVEGDTATITFTEPTSNPSGTIYTAYAMEDPTNISNGTVSPLTLSGLERGATYQFGVTATSPSGTASSAPGLSAPVAVPMASVAAPYSGQVVAWGVDTVGELAVPADLGEVVSVDASQMGNKYAIAATKDGRVVVWGGAPLGVQDVPVTATDVVQVAAGADWAMALRRDGRVIVWGNASTRKNLETLTDIVQIATNGRTALAVHADGTLTEIFAVSGGGSTYPKPAGIKDVVQVAAGTSNVLALHADGTATAWGNSWVTPAAKLTNVIKIASGDTHAVALKEDGTVVAWGTDTQGSVTSPNGATGVRDIGTTGKTTYLIRTDGTVDHWGNLADHTIPASVVNPHRIVGGNSYVYAVVPAQ